MLFWLLFSICQKRYKISRISFLFLIIYLILKICCRLGQSEPAPLQHDMDTYKKRLMSFGFNAIVVDGHDVEELCKAFHEAENTKV